MRDSVYRISLDIHNETPQVQIAARQGDSARRVYATLHEYGKPYTIPVGCRAVSNVTLPNGKILVADCDVRADGTVVFDFTAPVTENVGLIPCEIRILGEDGAVLYTPTFTILVDENAAEDGQKHPVYPEDLADVAKSGSFEDLKNVPDISKGAYLVTANYDFINNAIISVDKDPDEWELGGDRPFVLRLTDGTRTLDLVVTARSNSGAKRWLLVGNRPTGENASGLPYVITDWSKQQPAYIYATMGISATVGPSGTFMLKRELESGKWLWISDMHVVESLSGIARDGQITPAAEDVFAFLPLTSAIVGTDYPNAGSLPVHTVCYASTDWFTSGVENLPTGYYYITTTGKKSSGYGEQLAINDVTCRTYCRRWIANASETGGGHYGTWKITPQTDANLTEEGVPADARQVGIHLFGDEVHANRIPNVLRRFTGTITTALSLPINCWKDISGTQAELTAILGCSDDAETAAERFPFTLRPNYSYILTKYHRVIAAQGGVEGADVVCFELESWDGKERYHGFTSVNNTGYPIWKDYSPMRAGFEGQRLHNERNAVEVYCDYDLIPEFWLLAGGLSKTNGSITYRHTNLLPVEAGKNYYTATTIAETMGQRNVGAWFDASGTWIAPLQFDDVSELVPSYDPNEVFEDREIPRADQDSLIMPAERRSGYVPDNGANTNRSYDYWDVKDIPATAYPRLYYFTAPTDAAYLSMNIDNSYPGVFETGVCSKPMYMSLRRSDLTMKRGDPAYEVKNKKTLCIIGPSTVMINGLRRYHAQPNRDYSVRVCGFQNYLRPFYKYMKCYGYSAAPTMKGNGSYGRISLYTRVCGGSESFAFTKSMNAEDLNDYDVGDYIKSDDYGSIRITSIGEPAESGKVPVTFFAEFANVPPISLTDATGAPYNEFLIDYNTNGLTNNNIGTYDTTDVTTYMGALRAICQRIKTVNPAAVIYLPYVESKVARTAEVTRQVKLLCADMGLCPIDRRPANMELNADNIAAYTYDGTHLNNVGQQLRGLAYRRAIIGI